MSDIILGIDLGTTNSAVGVFEDAEPRILHNELNEPLTPSVVAWDERQEKLVVGRAAKDILALHPDRAAAVFKRAMGLNSRFTINGQEYGPVELSGHILNALRTTAETALGESITRAVITVPAYFNEDQRYATMKAAEIVGLKVERILNEPTAAAIAYGMHERDKDATFLVFDLGGGTFDVSIMERFEGALEVRSTSGESRLGGEDFTLRLAAALLEDVGKNLEYIEATNPDTLALLVKACEVAKRELTDKPEVEVRLPKCKGFDDGHLWTVTRERFEKAVEPLVKRLLIPCRAALRGASLNAEELDEVILVGGATRMPVVRKFAKELFRREPLDGLNPDLTVVVGATIQAALCADDHHVEDVVVTDVLSHSLGSEVVKMFGSRIVQGYFSPVIHRNTVIPTSRTDSYFTVHDNQTHMTIEVYEGESRRTKDNRFIGKLEVTGIPKGASGQEVKVRFTYDLNGVLEVEAVVTKTGKSFTALFEREAKGLTEAELNKAKARIAKLKADPRDQPKLRELWARAELLLREMDENSRPMLESAMDMFEEAVEGRNPQQIDIAATSLRELCDRMDGGLRW